MEHRRLGPLEPGAEWGSGGDRPAPGAAQTVPKGSRAGTACGVPGTLYLEHLLHGGGSSCCGFASLGARDRPQRWPGLWDEGFQCADDGPALLAEGHAFGAGERPGGWEGDSPEWALGTARHGRSRCRRAAATWVTPPAPACSVPPPPAVTSSSQES